MKRTLSFIFILILSNICAQQRDSLLRVSLKLNSDTDRVLFFYKEGFAKRASDPLYSFECAKLAESFAKGTELPFYIAKANNLLGILHYRKGDLVTALVYHKRALEQRKLIKDKKGMAMSFTNLGNVYSDLKHFILAEEAYKNALKLNEELGEKKQIGNCYLNLGTLKFDQGSVRKDSVLLTTANEYFSLAQQNAIGRNDYELQALCLNNMAISNINMSKFDAAIANSENALKARELMDDEMGKADTYLNLALAYYYKKENASGDENLTMAEDIITKFDYLTARINLLKIKADHLLEENKLKEAYMFLTRHYYLRDSLGEEYKKLKLENEYSELEPGIITREFEFPYLYLNILLIGCAAAILFVLKNKT